VTHIACCYYYSAIQRQYCLLFDTVEGIGNYSIVKLSLRRPGQALRVPGG